MSKVVVKDDAKILERVKESFQKMQKSWWEFAKLIYEVRETESYKLGGYETFKEYCEEELPSTNFKSIMKFVTVVEIMGKSIEAKLEKDKSYALPAYEACYTLSAMREGAMSKEDMSRLKRDVLERKLSYHKLRDRIKELLTTKKKELKRDIKKSEDEIMALTKKLEEDIGDVDVEIDDDIDGEEFADFDSVDVTDELVSDDYETTLDELFTTALQHSGELFDALEMVETGLKGASLNKKTEKFAMKIEKTYEKLDAVLTKIEEME